MTHGIFNSVLVNCLPLFGGFGVIELKELQILQNKAARIVSHSPPRAHRAIMYSKLQWLTVNQLVAYHTLLTVFKIRQTGEPEYLAGYLLDDNRAGRIIIPNTQLSLAKNSFVWRGSLSWNLLPLHLRNSSKIGHFAVVQNFFFVRYRSLLTADLSNKARMSYFFKRDKKGVIFIMQYHYIV